MLSPLLWYGTNCLDVAEIVIHNIFLSQKNLLEVQGLDDKTARSSACSFPVSSPVLPSSRETSVLQHYCIFYFVYVMSFLFLQSFNLRKENKNKKYKENKGEFLYYLAVFLIYELCHWEEGVWGHPKIVQLRRRFHATCVCTRLHHLFSFFGGMFILQCLCIICRQSQLHFSYEISVCCNKISFFLLEIKKLVSQNVFNFSQIESYVYSTFKCVTLL